MIRHLSGIRTDCATARMISSFMKKSNKRCLFCLMLIQGDSRGGEILEIQCAGISLAATFGCCQQRK